MTLKDVQERDEMPKHHKKVKHKPYGIEHWSPWLKKWCFPQWYATEKSRDLALATLRKNGKNSILARLGLPKYRKTYRK